MQRISVGLTKALDSVLSPAAGDSIRWRSLGVLCVLAGFLSLITLRSGVDQSVDASAIVVIGVLALAFGALLAFTADRLSHRWMPAGLLIATVGVSAAVLAGGEPDTPYSLLYVWIGAESWYFLKPRHATTATAVVLVFSMATFAIAGEDGEHDSVAWWLMISGTMVVVTALTAILRGRSERLVGHLSHAATHDALTGLLDRRGFQERIDGELARAHRLGLPLAVIVGDFDRFKKLNDSFGHRAGDDALITFARLCRSHIHSGGIVARVGGEEFAVVLPGLDREEAMLVAERLRRAVTEGIADPAGRPLTASFGVAIHPEHGTTAETLLDRADQAMYAAKTFGRNRVVFFSDDLPTHEDQSSHEQLQAVLVLAETLDIRDAGTARHSQVVAQLCEQTAAELGLPADRVERIRLAGLLHDIGKLGVSDDILHKPGPLTEAEFAEMHGHSEIGARIVASAGLDDIAGWVLAHHERHDGRGYPNALPADRIPLEARVLSIADAYEAMTADRPYRQALGHEAAVTELERCSGSQFDPQVVAAFLAAVDPSRAWRADIQQATSPDPAEEQPRITAAQQQAELPRSGTRDSSLIGSQECPSSRSSSFFARRLSWPDGSTRSPAEAASSSFRRC